jgi:hypothetical protein
MKIVFPLLAPLLAVMTLALVAPQAYPNAKQSDSSALPSDTVALPSALIVHVSDLFGEPVGGALVRISAIGAVDPVWMGLTSRQGVLRTGQLDRGTYWIHVELNGVFSDQVVRLKSGTRMHVSMLLGDQ